VNVGAIDYVFIYLLGLMLSLQRHIRISGFMQRVNYSEKWWDFVISNVNVYQD